MFHHHEGRILSEGLHQGSCALDVGGHFLMTPPLMRDLMGGDIERQINGVRFLGVHTGNKADALRKRNGISKGLRKACVTRELDYAQLMELERAEIGGAVCERLLHACIHAVQVELMAGVVVDLQAHVIPAITPDLIPAGVKREKIQNGGIHFVLEVAAPILQPFFLQVSRCDGNLVRAGADGGFKIDPVTVLADEIILPRGHIVQRRHALYLVESVLAARTVIAQLNRRVIPDIW